MKKIGKVILIALAVIIYVLLLVFYPATKWVALVLVSAAGGLIAIGYVGIYSGFFKWLNDRRRNK